jgi:hypothetical protein
MSESPQVPRDVLESVTSWDAGVIVEKDLVYRTLDFILARATQNHKLHQDWNEGAGDFVACTRGDCTEVKALLNEWGLGYR